MGAGARHERPAWVLQTHCTRYLARSLCHGEALLGAEVGLGASLCFDGRADASVMLSSGWERCSCTGAHIAVVEKRRHAHPYVVRVATAEVSGLSRSHTRSWQAPRPSQRLPGAPHLGAERSGTTR